MQSFEPDTWRLYERFVHLEEGWLVVLSECSGANKETNGLAIASVVRSAAISEQTFGGINSQLWDDPFEWTLPEELDSPEKVREYLAEVAAARENAFARITGDDQLLKEIWTPSGHKPLGDLLRDTIRRSALLLGHSSDTAQNAD